MAAIRTREAEWQIWFCYDCLISRDGHDDCGKNQCDCECNSKPKTRKADIAWMVVAFVMMFVFGFLFAAGITQ